LLTIYIGEIMAQVVLEVIVGSVVELEQDREISALRNKAQGSKESLVHVMRSYNQMLAESLGITPQKVEEVSARKKLPIDLPKLPQIGPNSTEEDWLEDYDFRSQGTAWRFGFQRSDPKEIFGIFDPSDSNLSFKIGHNKLTVIGAALNTLSVIGICLGLSALASPYDHPAQDQVTFDNAKWWLAGSAIFASLGVTCHWQAWNQKNEAEDRFNLKMKLGLFPLGGVK
jgi:hypothetical protein